MDPIGLKVRRKFKVKGSEMYGKWLFCLGVFVIVASMSACLPHQGAQKTVIAEPVQAASLQQQLVGNSLFRQGWRGAAKFRFASHHHADGTVSAKSWSFGGETKTTGQWYISDDGLYCRTWDNFWAEGKEGCFSVMKSPNDGRLIFNHVRGLPGSDRRYVYQVLAGNPHSL